MDIFGEITFSFKSECNICKAMLYLKVRKNLSAKFSRLVEFLKQRHQSTEERKKCELFFSLHRRRSALG